MMRKVVAIWRVKTLSDTHILLHCVGECGHQVDAPISLRDYRLLLDDPDYEAHGNCLACDQVEAAGKALTRWRTHPTT